MQKRFCKCECSGCIIYQDKFKQIANEWCHCTVVIRTVGVCDSLRWADFVPWCSRSTRPILQLEVINCLPTVDIGGQSFNLGVRSMDWLWLPRNRMLHVVMFRKIFQSGNMLCSCCLLRQVLAIFFTRGYMNTVTRYNLERPSLPIQMDTGKEAHP